MQVIDFIKKNGVARLTTDFGIKVKPYHEEGLIVLNYDQIESPKTHPIVMECRSLIIDRYYNVVSRSFDRFFNYGEAPETQAHIDWSKAVCYEKVDGSLIKIYNYEGYWYVATRGTAFAESTVNGFPITFKELVCNALNCTTYEALQKVCNNELDPAYTYIFEVTSTENRVVKVYEGYKLHYLGARNNATGEYGNEGHRTDAYWLGAKVIQQYRFSTPEECIETAKHLKDLDEGYVLWQDGKPVCKIKSPAYVAVHHIRGEGLNPKRISQLVLTGEHEEYLTYFPEDRAFIEPYVIAKDSMHCAVAMAWVLNRDTESQKDFANAVKDYPYSALLFQYRKNPEGTLFDLFHKQREEFQIKLLGEFVE
jgi:T4 RnlA family RNA ligase